MPEQSDLVASLGKLSLSPAITDPPRDFEKLRSKLIKYVESTVKANEKYHKRNCEKFYIGKSTIYKRSEGKIDPNDPKTWDTSLIRSRWSKHNKKEEKRFCNMKVLCVVTDKTLKSRQPAEQCTLDLEHGLIAHFMHKNDERLENESTAAGKCTTSKKKRAHVLYLVMKFGPKKCKCGSTTHRRTSHHECRLRKPCKCGSTSHQRTNHRNCPHNKKYKK